MAITTFTATAVTCDVVPGAPEASDDGMQHIRGQQFFDVVESQEPRIAGVNRPLLDLDFDPESGDGDLRGSFVLTPSGLEGAWEGELQGRFVQGLVRSAGMARGAGALAGAVLQVEFRQVTAYPSQPPCESPKAFFEMNGMILE